MAGGAGVAIREGQKESKIGVEGKTKKEEQGERVLGHEEVGVSEGGGR